MLPFISPSGHIAQKHSGENAFEEDQDTEANRVGAADSEALTLNGLNACEF